MSQQTSDSIIYSKPECVYCKLAKQYFDSKNIVYEEYTVGVDITQQEYNQQFARNTVPYIILNGRGIGGYDDLVDYLVNED